MGREGVGRFHEARRAVCVSDSSGCGLYHSSPHSSDRRKPKSRMLTPRVGVRNTFGFRSRCAMCLSWAAASPRAMCAAVSTDFADRQRSARETPAGFPFEQFNREGMAVAVPDIEDHQDVGVREHSNRVRFSLESRERIRVCCDGGWDDLDRDVAIQSSSRAENPSGGQMSRSDGRNGASLSTCLWHDRGPCPPAPTRRQRCFRSSS